MDVDLPACLINVSIPVSYLRQLGVYFVQRRLLKPRKTAVASCGFGAEMPTRRRRHDSSASFCAAGRQQTRKVSSPSSLRKTGQQIIANKVRTRGAPGNHHHKELTSSCQFTEGVVSDVGVNVQHLPMNLPGNPVKTAAARLLLALRSLPIYPHSLSDAFAGMSAGLLPANRMT